MWVFNSIFGKIFEILFYPVKNISPWFGMILISFLTSILMLVVFKFTSNQAGIRKVKNKIKAHLLELRLFKDSLAITLKAPANIFRYNIKYIGYTTKPLLIMIIPLILTLFQLNTWFAYNPLKTNTTVIAKVKFDEGIELNEIEFVPPSGDFIISDAPPIRITLDNEINWRFKLNKKGVHSLTFNINDSDITKEIIVGQKFLSKTSHIRVRKNFIDELFNPGEAPFSRDLPVKYIEIKYPAKKMNFFGLRLHWLIAYFALSIIFGFALKGIFKVEI